jgi:hypothetical protein
MKYPRIRDGEGVTLKAGERFKFACCDCGLVHDMVIVAEGRNIGLALRRNQRSTAAMRRHKK